MPVHYFAQLGSSFLNFLLDYVEAPPTADDNNEIPDVFVGLICAYNLQFSALSTNVTVACLADRSGAKTWTEKILLLLNREEDPAALFKTEFGANMALIPSAASGLARNSVQKVILEMFMHENCHQLFYTNDIYVLIDIIIRQVMDLSANDAGRGVYLKMAHLVLTKSDYNEHLHRYKDLNQCWIHVLEENEDEEDTADKLVVKRICRDIQAFNSLV